MSLEGDGERKRQVGKDVDKADIERVTRRVSYTQLITDGGEQV